MSPESGLRHSRWRTWLRGNTPDRLYDHGLVVPKARDCGDHEWYNHDNVTEHCYHCEAERSKTAATGAAHEVADG
jgi:hypothetical protein